MAQILVVVASIQMRTLKTDVGKVSVSTVIGHGLVGPEAQRNCVKWGAASPQRVQVSLHCAERESG